MELDFAEDKMLYFNNCTIVIPKIKIKDNKHFTRKTGK